MTNTKPDKEARFFKVYAVAVTIVCVILTASAFALQSRQKFEEITVERINIVERDGKPKLVISRTIYVNYGKSITPPTWTTPLPPKLSPASMNPNRPRESMQAPPMHSAADAALRASR